MSLDEKDVKGYEQDDTTVTVAAADELADEDVLVDVHTHLCEREPLNRAEAHIDDGVHRNMEQRHMQMIALAGTLGTGLFLGSGKAIAHGGPLGALLAYTHVGTVCYCMSRSSNHFFFACAVPNPIPVMSLGEMAVFAWVPR